MKILLQCLLLLTCNALAFSAEILAWKTPIARIAQGGKASPKLERLEKPPEASPFFGKDDELWNVTSIMPNDEEVTENGNGRYGMRLRADWSPRAHGWR